MNKPALLILPGWGGTTETWQKFVTLASQQFDVSCFNLPCFGDTPCPESVWGVEDYAAFVLQEMKKRDIERPILLGHSFGGQVAVRLAAEHPELFSALVLVGAAVIRQKRPIRRTFFWLIAKIGNTLFRFPLLEKGSVAAKKLLYRAAGSPDYPETAGLKRDILKKIIREDHKKLLRKITMPTLIVWGTKDRYTPLRYGKKIARLMPHATFLAVPNGKHGLHIQMPEFLLKKVIDFIYEHRA